MSPPDSRSPPSLLARAPVSVALAGAAAVVFVAGLAGRDVSRLHLDVRTFHGEPWRAVTTILPHSDVLHLAFNVLWLLRLGPAMERGLGSLPFLLFAAASGAGAALAEYAISGTAVGLSGVGFGMVAFLALTPRDPRFAGALRRQDAALFAGWFVFCIVTTAAGVWRVANVAHAGGALLGGLAALGLRREGRSARTSGAEGRAFAPRALAIVGAVAFLGASIAGATVLRPRVHLLGSASADAAYLGFRALEDQDHLTAETWLREAIRVEPSCGSCWHNLGVALSRADRHEESLEAFRRAAALPPVGPQTRPSLAEALLYLGTRRLDEGRTEEARAMLEEATELDPSSLAGWINLGVARNRLGDRPGAEDAFRRAKTLPGGDVGP